MPFDLTTREFIDRDGKRHLVERLADAFLVSMARRMERLANNATTLAVLAMLKAEAERRGVKVHSSDYYRLLYEGGTCFCGAVALYVVGRLGFCRKHKIRAELFRRMTRARQLKRKDEAAAMWCRDKRAADYRSLNTKALKALKTR